MRSEPCNVGNSVNTAFLLDIQRNIEVLEEHEVFAGIITAQPLPIKQGQGISSGVDARFNLECYKLAIAECGHYKAGCNLLWLNLTFSPLPHVPIRKSAVLQLKDHYFPTPQLFPKQSFA